MIDPGNPNYRATPVSASAPVPWYSPRNTGAKPTVTVVTPFFNTGAVFCETAASVLRQSMQQLEWIIVDDGSTDAQSIGILAEHEGKDPRIRILRAPQHVGLPAARNLGVAAANSDFLLFLDSDDLLEPTAAEKLLWFLQCRPELAFARGYTVCFGAQQYLYFGNFEQRNRFLIGNCVPVTSMIRRSVYQAVGGMSEDIQGGLEDWDFWLKCAAQGFWGATANEFLDWYRRRESHRDRWENLSGEESTQSFLRAFREKYPALYRDGFPNPAAEKISRPALVSHAPCENRLARAAGVKPLLLLLPHCESGPVLDLIRFLTGTHPGYQVTVIATGEGDHPQRPEFEGLVPDLFVLKTFLPREAYRHFLQYAILSRDCDFVLIAGTAIGSEMRNALRQACPKSFFADYLGHENHRDTAAMLAASPVCATREHVEHAPVFEGRRVRPALTVGHDSDGVPEPPTMPSLSERFACGNVFVLPGLIEQSGIGLAEVVNALALIFSPRHFFSGIQNLILLRRVFSNPESLHRLRRMFDSRFYRDRYEDIRRHNAIPLLHYALVGYREGRFPRRDFDPEVDIPPPSGPGQWDGNPLLRQALRQLRWP